MPNFAAFISYVLITTFTPGPNNIMSMSNASRYGFKKSLKFNFGVYIGDIIILALCGLFSVTLFKLIPAIKPYMTFIGAAYILWLAWKIFKSKPHAEEEEGLKTNTFATGFALQFVNLKVILYGITVISTFIAPYYDSPFAIAGFIVMLATVGLSSTCSWALFGSIFQKFIGKYGKAFNTVMALLLVFCAVSLFL